MKKIFSALIFTLFFVTFSRTQAIQYPAGKFSKDFGIYREIVEKSHSGLYLYTSKNAFDSIFKSNKEFVDNNPLTDREFYLLISRIHTQIRCGHSSIEPSAKVFEQIDTNKIAFLPFQVKFIKDTLVFSKDFRNLKKGSRILRINGKSIAQIKEDAFQIITTDGYNQTFKYRSLEELFFYYYFLLYGESEEIVLEYVPFEKNQKESYTISSIEKDEYSFLIHFGEEDIEKMYDLSYPNESTALLTVNSFSTETKFNQLKFFRFLKKSFKEIDKKNIQNLIVDVRKNTGGDDGNDMRLASYLINDDFKENKFRRLNNINIPVYPELLTEYWREMIGVKRKSDEKIVKKMHRILLNDFYLGEDGNYYYKEKSIIHEKKRKHGFQGQKYVLISGKVFSGGALFSALVRDKSNTIFVGEETGGGYYRHTGSIPLDYQLPTSGLGVSLFIIVAEQDVNQQLFAEGHGTSPHYEIYPTVNQFVNDFDAVLEFVLNQL